MILDLLAVQDTAQLEQCVSLLTEAVKHAIQKASKPDCKSGRAVL
jgi:hypothetical protein